MKRIIWLAIVCLLVGGCQVEGAPPLSAPLPATRPADFAFYVISDTHLGAKGMEQANQTLIEQLHALPGTAWPETVGGGEVAPPRAVLHLGDITDSGQEWEWDLFAKLYGLDGQRPVLKYPLLLTYGNHDYTTGAVVDHVKRRHKTIPYAWDWDGVHFVMLGMYPNEDGLEFLRRDLPKVGRDRPVILATHYPMAGPYSDYWKPEQKAAFARTIAGYNVVAIFHGHYHVAGRYLWEGYNVFRTGAPRHNSHQFIVARVRDGKLSVCWWDWDKRRWEGQTITKDLAAPTTAPAPAVP